MKQKHVMPAQAGIRRFLALAGTAFLVGFLSPSATLAEDYTYAPQGCDFVMTFPEEPRVAQRCHDKIADKCELTTSYTKVFDMNGAVNFYVSCKPTESDLRKDYTPDALRTALLARPGADRLEVYDVTYDDNDLATTSAILGAGKTQSGKDVMVYVAQIWVGASSVFTMEGELIGNDVPDADKLFSDILGSLHHKDWKPAPEQQESGEEKSSPPPEKAP